METCALKQLDDLFKKYAPLPDYQSAYRQSYSCKIALAKLINDVLWRMENSKATAFTAIDLLVAFDTVVHRILLDILQHYFGLTGKTRKWFESYLSPWQFQVNIGKTCSEPIYLEFSVPKGHCAGPILFFLYGSTTTEVISPSLDIHGYVDDHGVKGKLRAAWNDNKIELVTIWKLESCLESFKTWMDVN